MVHCNLDACNWGSTFEDDVEENHIQMERAALIFQWNTLHLTGASTWHVFFTRGHPFLYIIQYATPSSRCGAFAQQYLIF